MSGGRLSLKPGEPLPPPTAEQVLARLAGDIPPVPRSQLKKGVEPRDWRWFVGGLGRVLISLGLLIFAFVGYQLWGTGIQYRQHQNALEEELAELKASLVTNPAPSVEVIPIPDQPPASDNTTPEAEPVAEADEPAEPEATDPAVAPPVSISQFDIQLGKGISFLQIPALELDTVLVAGVRTEDLKKGVGHFPDTPMPGQPGNAAIAGHRTTHGAPFGNLDRLVSGDRVVLDTLQGHYEYVVTGSKIVEPSDYTVVSNVPDQNLLTLVTCHPKYTAKLRLIVTAALDLSASTPLAAAEINYGKDESALGIGADGLAEEAEPSADGQADAGVDTTLAAQEPSVVTDPGSESNPTTDSSVDGSVGEPAASDQPEPTAGGALGTDDEAEQAGVAETSADAFAAGWFSDPDAWPQVALWGLACTAVSLLAWLLGRKTRNWFSALVGIGPFVVVLYFFFENVNRLLPPNL